MIRVKRLIELTDREKKMVYIHMIMHSPTGPYENLDLETRENMLAVTLKLRGMEYDQREMLELGESISQERKKMLESGTNFLSKNKGILKHIKDFKF